MHIDVVTIFPDLVRAAAASVRRGRAYSLGIPVQSQGIPLLPERVPQRLTLRSASDGEARLISLHVDGDSRPALVGRWRPGL